MTRRAGRTRRTTALVSLCFLISALASIGLTVLYGFGGQPQLEGTLIFVALGGLSIGFVLWGKHLMPAGPYVEEREPMQSRPEEREAFARDFFASEEGVERRTFLFRGLLAALGALGVAAIFPIRSLGPSPGGRLFRTSWRRGLRLVTPEGRPVAASDLRVGSFLTVFPEGKSDKADSQTVLIRVDPRANRPLPGRGDWAPDGFLAYSKVCTHAGCPVGLYEAQTNRLFCPCHQSVFDVLRGAEPVGGPATRPLPQLPISVDRDGFIRARGDFSQAVGPEWWNFDPGRSEGSQE